LYREVARKIVPQSYGGGKGDGIQSMSMGTVNMEFEDKMVDFRDYNITVTQRS
jgi:hypothetical protein